MHPCEEKKDGCRELLTLPRIMLVKTTQYKSSGISSANLLRTLEIFDLPPVISPELNKCPGSNPVMKGHLKHFEMLTPT